MNQAIGFMLADMKTEIDASRLLVWRPAWLANNGGYVNDEGSLSKLKAGRTATWVTERRIQILGRNGNTREYPTTAGTVSPRSRKYSKALDQTRSAYAPAPAPD